MNRKRINAAIKSWTTLTAVSLAIGSFANSALLNRRQQARLVFRHQVSHPAKPPKGLRLRLALVAPHRHRANPLAMLRASLHLRLRASPLNLAYLPEAPRRLPPEAPQPPQSPHQLPKR
ncbi:MAG: hypothetical protein IPP57_27090 [Candidatus Obscuribacter sp.]|nr:hypothetical protein [Candidatus Obscuribacter sp.]